MGGTGSRQKPGLVVGYIGIAQDLREALGQYWPGDRDKTGVDKAEVIALLQEEHDVVFTIFHGFDYHTSLVGTPRHRLSTLAGAIE